MDELWRRHTLDIYGVELFAASTREGWRDLRKTLPFISEKPGASGLTDWSVHRFKGDEGKGTFHGHLVLYVDAGHIHTTRELVEICAHEAHHGAHRILNWAEVSDEEASAHLSGWLAGWLFDSVTDMRGE